MGTNGLVVHRDGGWNWLDWGSNIDQNVLDNEWYYLALKAAIPMAAMSGSGADTTLYRQRMNSIASNFVASYWNTSGQFFRSSSVTTPDDRANAMAVISGLAQPQHYAGIRTVLQQRTFASPWMEKFVLEALCMMGADSLSLARMKSRYTTMVNANYTTLWEVWRGLDSGTINHGWNAPNTVLSQYIVGLSPTAAGWSSYHVLPQMGNLTAINGVVPSIKGNITVSDSLSASQFVMNLTSPGGTAALVGIPKKRAWQSVTGNGLPIWNQGDYSAGVTGITGAGEDSLYIKFNVDPGTYRFVASLTSAGIINPGYQIHDAMPQPVVFRRTPHAFEIKVNAKKKYFIAVYDCSGKTVYHISPDYGGKTMVPFRLLKNNVYFVRLAMEGKQYSTTFVSINKE